MFVVTVERDAAGCPVVGGRIHVPEHRTSCCAPVGKLPDPGFFVGDDGALWRPEETTKIRFVRRQGRYYHISYSNWSVRVPAH